MDRRLFPFSGRVAHSSLHGQVEAEVFSDGEAAMVTASLANILVRPGGPRDRQLIFGDALTVLDEVEGHVFVQSTKDGYCGWLAKDVVGPFQSATHWVAALASHVYSDPKVQAPEGLHLPMGAKVRITGQSGRFSETAFGFVPTVHLRPLNDRPTDPVCVATMFLGAPYLWGGNSHTGIDCSGLVQTALLACGQVCPGDSDLQQSLGWDLPHEVSLARGDLLFWKGHVAIVVDDTTLIHANGYSMSVAYEDIEACISRIETQNGGPVTARRRLAIPS
jgi:cell wall-associated NlpC family hydrolase